MKKLLKVYSFAVCACYVVMLGCLIGNLSAEAEYALTVSAVTIGAMAFPYVLKNAKNINPSK